MKEFLKRFYILGRTTSSIIKKGFSLVEIIVITTIAIIMMGIMLVDYRVGQRRFVLESQAYKIAQDMRRAQTMAGLEKEECKNGGVFDPNYKYGYGIVFKRNELDPEKNNYYLIADCNGNRIYEESSDIILETMELEQGIKRKEDLMNYNLSIIFEPPDPIVSIREDSEMDSALITIYLEREPEKEKEIKINKAGLIDVN